MRSHFRINNSAVIASAVAGAATMLNGHCAAQPLIAADYATNSTYAAGWAQGQNGGFGFGPWGFDGNDPAGSSYQSMSTASALGTAWTLFTTNSDVSQGGLANVGRAILESGGLQVGQTFQTIIQNPVNNAGIYTYRGFDILFYNGTANDPAGINTAALRLTVFDYFNAAMNWTITDMEHPPGTSAYNTEVSAITTGESGMIISLTLDSTNTYTLTMAPVGNPNSPYLTYSDTFIGGTNLPINYVNFRNWNIPSSDTNDVADNFEISSMTIQAAPLITLNIQPAGQSVILSWSASLTNFVLASSPALTNGSAWSTNLPAPVVSGNLNFVTNPISGSQQFFRLQSP